MTSVINILIWQLGS